MAERFATRGASVSIATQGFADFAAGPAGTRRCPLFRAWRWPEPTWCEGGAVPGTCRILADFLGRDIASDFYALFNRSFIATENGRLLFEEMRRATEALAGM